MKNLFDEALKKEFSPQEMDIINSGENGSMYVISQFMFALGRKSYALDVQNLLETKTPYTDLMKLFQETVDFCNGIEKEFKKSSRTRN